ncbi:hypothetical protein J2Z60_001816 [Lactobacillus colini]|uniref:Uncharacterized protein n=1 Tax=Lactobacillus colini TaxID=1819254 RepID=A0ABS4MG17_9LACO|nr:hypothetical protein [Lactobacillus colini]MBP2058628.1 hypothetical protein [Lactobacillus colini]
MLSKNQTTKVEEKDSILLANSFGQSPSERLKRAKQQQAAIEEAQHQQDLRAIGWGLVGLMIGVLLGLAL